MGKRYEQSVNDMMQKLPPGLKFDPTDEEIVLHFLYSKVVTSSDYDTHHNNLFIPELEDFYIHYHPCQLHGEAFESCGTWYFYAKKTENRVSINGYWKEMMDMDQPIYVKSSNKLVGLKKYLVFYKGKFPSSGVKTSWVMQEYHAVISNFGGKSYRKGRSKQLDVNNWVLCRVQQICDDSQTQWLTTLHEDKYNNEVELSSSDEGYLAIEDDDEIISPY